MRAIGAMTTNVVTVRPDTDVVDIARVLLRNGISAVPVVDDDGQVVGIVSEGDLVRRPENQAERQHAWWLEAFLTSGDKVTDYIKTHARKARDVMTSDVVSVTKETPVREIAHLLEKHRIKRVPVIEDGKLIGIVSRANLLHGLAASRPSDIEAGSVDDQTIRDDLLKTLSKDAGIGTSLINVIVRDGTVQFWGLVDSPDEIEAARIAAENTPGVQAIENNLGYYPAGKMGY